MEIFTQRGGRVCAPLLKCISRDEGQRLLDEIHSVMCYSHIGKTFREGFFWPSAVADTNEVVRTFSNCQKHAHYSKFTPDKVHLIPPVWLVAQCGIDIVGPLPTIPDNYKFAAIALEYFRKWVEAKPLRDTAGALQKIFWQNIVCRFGVPKEVTVDNSKQFNCATLRAFCDQLGMKLCFASVYHPQSNGAVERANGVIFTGIKKNVREQPNGKWVDELPRVIWSHNIAESRVTKFSPFKLLYGEEAMTPEEIKFSSWRMENTMHEDMAATIDIIEMVKLQQVAENLNKYQNEPEGGRTRR
jgi:hypothetical protein